MSQILSGLSRAPRPQGQSQAVYRSRLVACCFGKFLEAESLSKCTANVPGGQACSRKCGFIMDRLLMIR
eukprot:5855850-Amphidinium_carterae.1